MQVAYHKGITRAGPSPWVATTYSRTKLCLYIDLRLLTHSRKSPALLNSSASAMLPGAKRQPRKNTSNASYRDRRFVILKRVLCATYLNRRVLPQCCLKKEHVIPNGVREVRTSASFRVLCGKNPLRFNNPRQFLVSYAAFSALKPRPRFVRIRFASGVS